MIKQDVCKAADENKIAWDGDPVFKMICSQIVGKTCLDKMSPSELKEIYIEITTNPAAFSKIKNNSLDQLFFRDNFDYSDGNYLSRVKLRQKNRRKK